MPNYSGVWTLQQQYQARGQNIWPGQPILDPYFNQTTLLLHGDGTNGAQNNTFLDSSTNNFTITRNGNTTQGTFTPFSQAAGYWGNYFDGAGDFLQPSSGSWSNLSTGNFTIECWVYLDSNSAIQLIADARGNDGLNPWQFYTSATGKLNFFYGSLLTGSTTILGNVWTHVAVVRSGSTITLYVNGVADGTASSSANLSGGATTYIGRVFDTTGTLYYKGYISNFRAVIGTAVYTANFTPSTTPLTAITNTSLLTCQSSRFVDNSTNNFTLTPAGNVAVQPFSPFLPTSAYNTAVNGGSGYFDGAGDYLSLASNAAFTVGTGDVTIETWVYINSFGIGYSGILSGRLLDAGAGYPGLGLVIDANKFSFTILNNNNALIDTVDAPTNQWVHVVGVRSGTSAALFVNGVRKVSSTNSENGTSSAMNLGRFYPAVDNYYFNGYISNARLVKGTAVYDPTQTTLTVPTAPFTNITNTSLLTNFTNAGIFDNAMKNDLETVGNAQISTSVVKFGTGSMAFDGTGDYLSTASTPNLFFGSGNFTIEAWVYANALGTYNAVVAQWPVEGSSTSNSFVLESVGSTMYFYWVSGTTLYGPATLGTIATGSWIHYAICRSGNTLYPFKNGVLGTTVAITQTLNSPTSAVTVGGAVAGGGGWIGYIDDLRITKGVARYTANFTPPTAAFPNQ